jgi:hypothetical protein
MPQGNVRNAELIKLLSSEFAQTADPTYLSSLIFSVMMSTPYNAGLWGFAHHSDPGPAIKLCDHVGGMHDLTRSGAGTVLYAGILFPFYMYHDGSAYWSHADDTHFDISLAENWIAAPGLGLFLMLRPTRVYPAANNEGLLSKWTETGNQRSYMLYVDAANNNKISFALSSNGTDYSIFRHNKALMNNRWHFIGVTYTPVAFGGEAAGCKIWVNDTMTRFTAPTTFGGGWGGGLMNAINNSTAPFKMSSYTAAAYEAYLLGFTALPQFCRGYVTELGVWKLYEYLKFFLSSYNEKGTSW